jgi:hypothetical protein
MRRAIPLLVSLLAISALSASPASAAFGLKDLEVTFTGPGGTNLNSAGVHPETMVTNLAVNTKPEPALPEVGEVPDEEVKDLIITQIPGFTGNPTAVPRCSNDDFLNTKGSANECPEETELGSVDLIVSDPTNHEVVSVNNLVPPPGVAAKLGFTVLNVPLTIELGVEPTPPYRIIARVTGVTQVIPFYASELTIEGTPGKVPFLITPRACEGPLDTFFEASSWQGSSFAGSTPTHDDLGAPLGFLECAKLTLSPREASVKPSTDQAESPSGLDFKLRIEDEGLANPEGTAQSDIKKTTVTLPEGVTLNPSIAEGLATCTKAGFEAEKIDSAPGQGCPQAAKVGSVEAESPLLEGRVLKGQLFVAAQDDPATPQPGAENPFDSLIALYMVVREPELGLLFKLAGKVTPDPVTGQIQTTFGEPGHELPQQPLKEVRIHLREGGRSPLITPPGCGTFTSQALFTPWANPSSQVEKLSSFQITKGTAGGECPPGGAPPFDPGFSAGSVNNQAGKYSPFNMRLTRRDGDQDLTRFSATLPPGLVGKLAGLEKCSDAQIAAAKAKSGREELASPSCPAGSEIGRTTTGAGVGSQLTYVPGKLYLAGPYNGDPLSVVAVVPAVAGPFDVGTVIVRVALRLNPVSAEVEVDGARSDPIPHILEGIVLKVRDIRVYADKPNFTVNPTSCAPMGAKATIFGSALDIFNPADDAPVNRADRFQAADCGSLGFKPGLTITLKGGTRRAAHPALRAIVLPRPGDANFGAAVVTLPRSAFLDQAHIRTICTRVQFAADACPKGAIYGKATVWTPLLAKPAQGPVYLRSSNHNLPDLVMALKGPEEAPVEVEVSARIDSHKGGIRSSFEAIPDFPVSRFVLEMQGGKKGLIVNSRNLCSAKSKAKARLKGQNNRRYDFNPVVGARGCGKAAR